MRLQTPLTSPSQRCCVDDLLDNENAGDTPSVNLQRVRSNAERSVDHMRVDCRYSLRLAKFGVAQASATGERQSTVFPRRSVNSPFVFHTTPPRRDGNVKTRMGLQRIIAMVMRRLVNQWLYRIPAVGLFAIALCVPRAEAFAPKSELWERWTAHSPSATASIDHGEWGAFLAKNLVSHADGVYRVAYAKINEVERKRLDDYLSALSAVRISD